MMRRNRSLVVVAGVFTLVCVVMAGIAGWWHYVNLLPVYPSPGVVMPVPNARDDYIAAGRLCREAGGTAELPAGQPRQAGPLRAPLPPNGRPLRRGEADVSLAQMRAVVTRNQPALARLRQGFRKRYQAPPVVSPDQPYPEFADYRELARVLATEGKLAEREGRLRDAARSYLDCLRLGVDIPRGGPLIHGLVGIAIQSLGLSALQGVADRLDGPTAATAAREMVRLDAQATSAADTLAQEKASMTTLLLQLFRQPGGLRQLIASTTSSSRPPSASEALAGLLFVFTPRKRVIDNMRGYMDALIAAARRPYYAQGAPPLVPNDPYSRVMLPIFGGLRANWARRDMQWRSTELRLAVRAYQQQHSASPASAAFLVPAYLPAVPQDPFAPRPLTLPRAGSRVGGR